MHSKSIQVALGERSYTVHIGQRAGSEFPALWRRNGLPESAVVVTDATVARLHLKAFQNNLLRAGLQVLPVVIPAGERQKNMRRAEAIIAEMLTHGMGRRTAVIAFGGGVVGDLAGFVASVFQRGVPVVQVPTTVIAQVDSAIGGKTGVNHALGKNLIGTFHQPRFVWVDTAYLKTLPSREVISGMGEIIKYGVIADAELFSFLEENLERVMALEKRELGLVLERCIAIKAAVVAEDEHERDLRAILNFGHTVGHALEAAGAYRLLKHGEAVLLGMAAETTIAQRHGLIDHVAAERIRSLIARVPMHVELRTLDRSKIIPAMGRDKKNVSARPRFVLPVAIGKVCVTDAVEREVLKDVVGK